MLAYNKNSMQIYITFMLNNLTNCSKEKERIVHAELCLENYFSMFIIYNSIPWSSCLIFWALFRIKEIW
jgi:hypothetical protein